MPCNILFEIFLQFAYFDIELQRIVQTYGEDFIDGRNIKIKKIPGTKFRGVFGSATIPESLDETFKVLTNIYVKQGGEYRLMPFKFSPQPLCEFVNNDKTYVPEFEKVSNFTQPKPCPGPKVKHSFITKVLIQFLFCQVTYAVDGYKATIPDALQLAAQTGNY
jgi:hypothetical protein